MREIKFRVWSIKDQKIYYQDGDWSFNFGELIFDFPSIMESNTLISEGFGKYELMQYTGLKDKNGKEIYEGDILQNNRYDDVGEVYWSNDVVCEKQEPIKGVFGEYTDLSGFFSTLGEFKIKSKKNKAYHIQDTEIIGNIYESKHLLDNTDMKE